MLRDEDRLEMGICVGGSDWTVRNSDSVEPKALSGTRKKKGLLFGWFFDITTHIGLFDTKVFFGFFKQKVSNNNLYTIIASSKYA